MHIQDVNSTARVIISFSKYFALKQTPILLSYYCHHVLLQLELLGSIVV
jgi:hypothetical protein